MALLASGSITLEKLEEILKTVKAKNLKYFNFTISIADESNQYGQNVSLFAEQTKEQREAKTKKYYFANGKVFWTDGKIQLAEKKQEAKSEPEAEPVKTEEDDMPF